MTRADFARQLSENPDRNSRFWMTYLIRSQKNFTFAKGQAFGGWLRKHEPQEFDRLYNLQCQQDQHPKTA